MTTQPVPVISGTSSTLESIEAIILAALKGLSLVPGGIGVSAGLISTLAGILVNAQQVYQQAAGVPYDLTKVPLETPVS